MLATIDRLGKTRSPWRVLGIVATAIAAASLCGTVAADDKPSQRAVDKDNEIGARRQSMNHLKQLALAMHNYNRVHKNFAPSAIFDKGGKPLLSWRVMLLPFLEQEKLYKEFHLDEPWDSEHNKKLLERMPDVYHVNNADLKPGETVYVGFTGKGTIFDGHEGIRISDVADGASNTFLFVESARPVPWTKPEDLPYDETKPVPKLGIFTGGFNAALCDGSVRWIKSTVSEKALRALITRNGGEVIDYSKF
jgi:hypothetical protein